MISFDDQNLLQCLLQLLKIRSCNVLVSQGQGEASSRPGNMASLRINTKSMFFVFSFFSSENIFFWKIIFIAQMKMIKVLTIVSTLVNILSNISISMYVHVCICFLYKQNHAMHSVLQFAISPNYIKQTGFHISKKVSVSLLLVLCFVHAPCLVKCSMEVYSLMNNVAMNILCNIFHLV